MTRDRCSCQGAMDINPRNGTTCDTCPRKTPTRTSTSSVSGRSRLGGRPLRRPCQTGTRAFRPNQSRHGETRGCLQRNTLLSLSHEPLAGRPWPARSLKMFRCAPAGFPSHRSGMASGGGAISSNSPCRSRPVGRHGATTSAGYASRREASTLPTPRPGPAG